MRHDGATFAVLGGGPSLPEQASRLPEGCIRLSANEHGCILGRCDYIVALDDTRSDGTAHEPVLRRYATPIISPHAWADYKMNEHPQLPYTGQQAVWVAWMLGARLVLVAGMDLYQGGTYFHAPEAASDARLHPADSHLEGWLRVRETVPMAVRAMGGPLVEVFGAYDPAEAISPRTPDRAAMLAQCAGIKVEFLRDCGRTRYGTRYLKGQILELPRDEAQRLMALRYARRHTQAADA
jgi:hypothetical protein